MTMGLLLLSQVLKINTALEVETGVVDVVGTLGSVLLLLSKKMLNSHHTREFTPHHTSWFSTTKGLDFEGMPRDRVNLIT